MDGKPAAWETVSKECLSLIHSLTSRLIAKEGVVSSAGPASSPTSPKSLSPASSSLNGGNYIHNENTLECGSKSTEFQDPHLFKYKNICYEGDST